MTPEDMRALGHRVADLITDHFLKMAGESVGAKGDLTLSPELRSLWAERAEVVLTAGTRGQRAWEDDEGRSIFTLEDLLPIGVSVGLDAAAIEKALPGDAYWESVRGDEKRAAELGISGVPFFVFGDVASGDALGISGAQSTERFAEALAKGWSETTARS